MCPREKVAAVQHAVYSPSVTCPVKMRYGQQKPCQTDSAMHVVEDAIALAEPELTEAWHLPRSRKVSTSRKRQQSPTQIAVQLPPFRGQPTPICVSHRVRPAAGQDTHLYPSASTTALHNQSPKCTGQLCSDAFDKLAVNWQHRPHSQCKVPSTKGSLVHRKAASRTALAAAAVQCHV
jgi:hypothetical protein